MNTEVKLPIEPLNHPVLSLPRKAGAPVTPTGEHVKVSVFDEMAPWHASPSTTCLGAPWAPARQTQEAIAMRRREAQRARCAPTFLS